MYFDVLMSDSIMRCRLLATLAASATPARVFAVALVLRLLNTLLVRTYAAPDEHWQAPELAHKLVFGVGYVCVLLDGAARCLSAWLH